MKYTATTMMGLLLLGVCFARNLDMPQSQDEDMKRKDDDSSKLSQDYRREGGQDETEDQKSQQIAQLKETTYQNLRRTYLQLTGYSISTLLDNLPELADPIEVGSVVDRYVFGTVNHKQVQFTGLHSAYRPILKVDTHAKKAMLTLNLNNAKISGSYEASDLIRKTSGDFNIKMSKDVTYVRTYPYEVQDGKVQLLESSGQLHYGSFDSHYENIGFFAQFLQNALGRDLLRTVNEKVDQELRSKLMTRIEQFIQAAVQEQEQNSVEKALQEGINNAISGIQQVVSKHRGFSIDLTSDDKEMVYNQLHAKIASVKLNGVERFYMAKNQVSEENSDNVRAKVELALDRPTATAVISLHESHDEDAPFQKMKVDFDMEQLVAELSLEKPVRQSGLQLRWVKASVNRIRPMGIEKFEGRVAYLIKEKMTTQMKHYIEEGLQNLIQRELSSIMRPDVLSQGQELRSAHKQM